MLNIFKKLNVVGLSKNGTTNEKGLLSTLYKRNAELGVKNKTLSLLSELYEISITTVSSEELAQKICVTILEEFDFELVGILLHKREDSVLKPIAYALSKRLANINTVQQVDLNNIILRLNDHPILNSIIKARKIDHTNSLKEIWMSTVSDDYLTQVKNDANVKSSTILPLEVDHEVIGIAIFSFNRDYRNLVSYEKDSINSFKGIIAIALKKALLDEQLLAANEKLKVLDKMKSEFVSIASHQLRSPLTSVRGYASMLLEGSFGTLAPKAKEAVERIAESSRFMASSVEDYLNVSRIQAGNMKYEYSDFNLKDLAERTSDDTRQTAMKKGLLLTFKSDLTKQGIVHADVGKTKQVIDNIINNSLKYTQHGAIAVFVYDDVKLKKIYVAVTDTGIGMSAHHLENLFGKFERADNANEINVTGTGLGLYIARKMAREMGGDILASSDGEGKGSTFTIELPLQN